MEIVINVRTYLSISLVFHSMRSEQYYQSSVHRNPFWLELGLLKVYCYWRRGWVEHWKPKEENLGSWWRNFIFGQIFLYFRLPSDTLIKIRHQPPSLQDRVPAYIVTFWADLVVIIFQIGELRLPVVASWCTDDDPSQLIALTLLHEHS